MRPVKDIAVGGQDLSAERLTSTNLRNQDVADKEEPATSTVLNVNKVNNNDNPDQGSPYASETAVLRNLKH